MNKQINMRYIMMIGLSSFVSYLLYAGLFQTDDVVKTAVYPQENSIPALKEVSPKQETRKPQVVVELPPLNIRLLSTMISEGMSSVIVITAEDSAQQFFKVGDSIQPGIRLHHVDVDAMVIEREGRLERVQRENTYTLSNSDAATDISTLITRAKLVPHYDGNHMDGFIISGIVVHSLFHKLGLYNGDVIQKMDRIALLHTNQLGDFYKYLNQNPAVHLDVMRAGHLLQLP